MAHHESVHPLLPPMRRVNGRTHEYAGTCPFCNKTKRDGFRVWLEPDKERYWCRRCEATGYLSELGATLGDTSQRDWTPPQRGSKNTRHGHEPCADHIPFYRQLYGHVALWAHQWLMDEVNPDPAAYLRGRGIDTATQRRMLLGYALRDRTSLVEYLQAIAPELMPYAEEAGVLRRNDVGVLQTHYNLVGTIVIPYEADGEIVDIRVREYPNQPGSDRKYRSLPGSYTDRGATFLLGSNVLGDASRVILTEGDLKIPPINAAYHAGLIDTPALSHPGLTYLRPEWAAQLRARGVEQVVLGYDASPRAPDDEGALALTTEERWTLRHGLTLAAAGLQVAVLRLPLAPGETKQDLDAYALRYGIGALQRLIDAAPTLAQWHASLPHTMLQRANLPAATAFPQRRGGAQILPDIVQSVPPATTPLAEARAAIPARVQAHMERGKGILVLAQPPGTGKGHGTTAGLRTYLDAGGDGSIVWTGIRKDQIADQHGLSLTPLDGRNPLNCHNFPQTQELSRKGYSVQGGLCQRRCPFVNNCHYLRQFDNVYHAFAPQPLLQATSWWKQAGMLVLDEFSVAQLSKIVHLNSAEIWAMRRTLSDVAGQQILTWLAALTGATGDATLSGPTLLNGLEERARADGLRFDDVLQAAVDSLPSLPEQLAIPGLSMRPTLSDIVDLAHGYAPLLIERLASERRRHRAGVPFTSRIRLANGRCTLFLRHEQLIQQLDNAGQPKIVLDATFNPQLFRALWPYHPLDVMQPTLAMPNRIVQVISADWAKTQLVGARLERWLDTVRSHIRPGRPTLLVCTAAMEPTLRQHLAQHGYAVPTAVVGHYGALRGSNAYKGYDVVLTQVYNPRLDAIIDEGIALFADDPTPLDVTLRSELREGRDRAGRGWQVEVIAFVDPRLQGLLETRRESEMVQTALRGRPFDHPDAQITILSGLPLPGLPPSEIHTHTISPTSSAGRQATALEQLVAAAQALLERGQRTLNAAQLAEASGCSIATVYKHWSYLARTLHLSPIRVARREQMHHGGHRQYHATWLVRRGRRVPSVPDPARPLAAVPEPSPAGEPDAAHDSNSAPHTPTVIDHAQNMDSHARVIYQTMPLHCHKPAFLLARRPVTRRRRRRWIAPRKNGHGPPPD